MNEAQLYEMFSTVGPVASVRVCRDVVTRRSLGYAYVNFQSSADADRALNTINYELINGKQCRIMWCQRDPTARRSGVGNIFVKGLEESIDNKALEDAFSIFGNILSVKVVLDGSGKSAGRGFVHFETAQDAALAIEKANGTLLREKKITVEHFKSRKERLEAAGRAENEFKNVYVKNLAGFTEEKLVATFAPYGEITSKVFYTNPDTSKASYGFVCFKEFADAKKAVEELNDKEVNGLKIFVGRAMKKTERSNVLRREFENRRKEQQNRSRNVNLYVKNLDQSVDNDTLRQMFEGFGTITSAKVMSDEKGVSRGFAFVCFATQEEATRALSELNTRLFNGKPLYVALAQPREERRHQLNMQYRQRIQYQRQPGFMPQPNMYGAPMMYIGGPAPFQQRQPQQFGQFGQRGPGARYGQPFPAQFGQQGVMPRQTRPSYPRQQVPMAGRPPIISGGAPRANARYTGQARNLPAAVPQQASNVRDRPARPTRTHCLAADRQQLAAAGLRPRRLGPRAPEADSRRPAVPAGL